MEVEVSLAAKIGLSLVILAACISVGYMIWHITFGVASEEIDDVTRFTENKLEDDLYGNYDNKYVSGTTVIDAIYKYANSDLAILVGTLSWYDDLIIADGNGDRIEDVADGVKTAYNGNNIPMCYIYENEWTFLKGEDENNLGYLSNISTNKGKNTATRLINYNKILGTTGEETTGSWNRRIEFNGVAMYEAELYWDSDNYLRCFIGFNSEEGQRSIENHTYININQNNKSEYISPSGRFKAYIIKNNLGEILGVAFIQEPNRVSN